MTLQWKQGSGGQTASDIIASDDAYADETIRTLQVSDPGGYAIVAWEDKEGVWETWAWGKNGWSFVAEFSSATKAKEKAQGLSKTETAVEKPVQAPPRIAAAVAASEKAEPAPKETLHAVSLVSDVGDPEQLNQQDTLGRETSHGKKKPVEVPKSEEAPPVKVWKGSYYGNPPMAVPKKQRVRIAAALAPLDAPQIPQIQPSQA